MRLAMDPVLMSFPAEPASVGRARNFAVDALAAWGLIARVDDVRLCVSELATNAVRHGNALDRCFTLSVSAEEDAVRVAVRDAGPGCPQPRRPAGSDDSGRGLHLVGVFSDAWGVEHHATGGKTVWSLFKTAPPRTEVPC
ncbi:ATP-binding protein [Streptomyces sp. NPDC018019]|uniref:ATP-binding protein n=1 Tax=Streptomyces sp. NPDC018019 TaxID=3365030 RepID=UPI003796001B